MKGFEPLGGVTRCPHYLYILTNNKDKACTAIHIKWWKAHHIDDEAEKYDGIFVVSNERDISYDNWHRSRISIWFDPTASEKDSHWQSSKYTKWLKSLEEKYNPNIDVQRFYDKEKLPNTLKQMINEL